MILRIKYLLDFINPPQKDVVIEIEDKKIKKISQYPLSPHAHQNILDYSNYIAIPPLVNAHTHLELTDINKSALNYRSFIDWVISLVKEKRLSNSQLLYNGYLNGLGKLQSYLTPFFGNIVSYDIIKKVKFQQFNENLNFVELISFDDNPDGEFIRKYSSSKMLSPHTFYTVSPKVMEQAFSFNIPLSIHLFESKDEIDCLYSKRGDIYDKLYQITGVKPFSAVDDIESFIFYLLDRYHKNVQFIHLCYLSGSFEKFLIKKSGEIVPTLSPRSNFILKNKLNFDFFLSNNIPFSLGTDSLLSNYDLNVYNEAKFIYDNLNLDFERESLSLTLWQALTVNGLYSISAPSHYFPLKISSPANFILVKWDDNKISYQKLFEDFQNLEKKIIEYSL